MNFNMSYAFIKSSWFDPYEKKTIASKITPEGLLVYLTLFKFRLHNANKNVNTFITSIGLISKELPKKYSKEKVYELLRLLQRNKVIKITNITNFHSQLKNEDGKINQDKVLVIEAIDYPKTTRENGQDKPVTDDDYFIAVHLPMIDVYLKEFDLDEKYVCLYVLMNKYNNNMNGFYMKIEKMEHVTGIDKNTINRMIWKLNELELLASYRQRKEGGNHIYHHFILKKAGKESHERFLFSHGEEIERMKKRIQRRKKRKEKIDAKKVFEKYASKDNENVESFVKEEKEEKLAFGQKPSEKRKKELVEREPLVSEDYRKGRLKEWVDDQFSNIEDEDSDWGYPSTFDDIDEF
ncbi:hypothetical protein BSNK01_22600 [Bacillaceae bacterium]